MTSSHVNEGERDARMTLACGIFLPETFLPETSPFTRNRLRDLLPDVDHQICRDGHSMGDSPCFEKEKSAMHVCLVNINLWLD